MARGTRMVRTAGLCGIVQPIIMGRAAFAAVRMYL